jgi:hypothetical protein
LHPYREIPEVNPMKTLFATIMIVALGITAVALWQAAQSRGGDVSFRQIYIHDTPVCVFRHGGEILAAVGACDSYGSQSWGEGSGTGRGSLGGSPYYRDAPSGLPPGHPPVDSTPEFDQFRKVPI